MRKNLIAVLFLTAFAVAPFSAKAANAGWLPTYKTVAETSELGNKLSNARSKHLGCVNSAGSCKRRAAEHGFSHSKIQQDFYCPKTIYSCYGW